MDKIRHNITIYIDNDGSVTISDFPSDLSDLVLKLLKNNEDFKKWEKVNF